MIKRALKLFISIIIFSLSSNFNVSAMTAANDAEEWKNDFDEPDESQEITKDEFRIIPGKKRIKKGKSFYIKIAPVFWSDFYDLSSEEWEEICYCIFDSIFYRSTNSKVASVNKKSGQVTGCKKGSTIIKTTIIFIDGSVGTYKTKVYVTN